jgi:hypothetical protein
MLTRIESGQLASSNTKRPCLVATTGNINITSAPSTIDGVSVGVDDRVLVWQQSNASQNAIYVITTISGSTTWVRAEDFSVSSDIYGGVTTLVISGNTYAKQIFTLEQPSSDPVVIGTTQLFFKPNTNSFIAGTNITKGYAVRLKDDGNIISLDAISGDTYPVIGIAQQSGTTGNTISVAIENTISKVHTGLTPGFDYYAASDGSISLNGDTYVGIALSSTDINVAFSSPSGAFIPSLSVIDNTIANSDGITTPGRYIVPVSGTTNLFVGEENKYADYDGTDFTFTTPINNDKVSIAVGTNAGNVYIYASGTTTWNLSAQVTTLPTSNWALGGTYKQNDLVIYQSVLCQANSNIPANTAFTLGTSGATFKQIGVSGSAEYGEIYLTSNVTINDTTTTILTANIPSAGVWTINYYANINYGSGSNPDEGRVFLVDSLGGLITGSGSYGYITSNANMGAVYANQITLTTTSATTVSLRGIRTSFSPMSAMGTLNVGAVSAVNSPAGTKISWNKIAGFLPATNLIVDNSSSNYIDIGNVRYQWGRDNQAISSGRIIIFPASFRNTSYSFVGSVEASDGNSRSVNLDTKTITQILIRVAPTSAAPFNWIAIGLKP